MGKKKDIAIVGYGETPVVLRGGRSSYELAADVLDQILAATGLEKSEIDGIAVSETMSETSNPFWAVFLAEHLGLQTQWTQVNGLGGASTIAGIARAAAAIRDGQCRTVLVIASDAQSSYPPAEQGGQRWEFQYPVGLRGPTGVFGMLMHRYEHQHGLDYGALAKLAVTQRNHALLNPNASAKLKTPLTEQDYLSSKFVSTPLRVLDSVMVCDGANGVLVTSAENAARLGLKKAVYPVGYGEVSNYKVDDLTADITESGFTLAGPKALAQAGMSARDVRMFHPYDDFLIAILLQLEQIGFCERGKGSRFILDTDFSYRGDLPLNTGGGQISAGQPGLAGGGLNLVEAVRQMFGEAGERQVEDPRNAMVTGIGVIPFGKNWSVSNVLILEQ
ncbi:thiolase family protein [Pigmentiphaga sp. NML080357]|uniref:thiolase family protein n=1 Tax=Pigmentiphaga sp. NML080357 TaxID=2008675 RepID=UPI0018E92122|nr:thiolase family protein [Pigmentiphaga sp. NML080357]